MRVIIFAAVWGTFGVVSGLIAHLTPARFVEMDTLITRIRPFERGGTIYVQRFRIRQWKDLLPEAGSWLPGGVSKRHMRSRTEHDFITLARETRRAEYVHLANLAFGTTFFIWTPFAIAIAMTAFGIAVHTPFVLVQRYNRARLLPAIERRQSKRNVPTER